MIYNISICREVFNDMIAEADQLQNRFVSSAELHDVLIFRPMDDQEASIEFEIICVLDDGRSTLKAVKLGDRPFVPMLPRKKERV